MSEIVARPKRTGGWNIYEKHRKTTTKPKSLWTESEVRTEAGTIDMRQLFQTPVFDHPKPVALIEKCLAIGSHPHSLVCDPFAGSGTTGHAVINLNHKDGGSRKYILIERADYVESVILPRLKKLTFTPTWIEGSPKITPQSSLRFPKKSSKIIQYFSLEQVEDVYLNTKFSVDKEFGDSNSKSISNPSTSRLQSDVDLLATFMQHEESHYPSSAETMQYKLMETPTQWKFSPIVPLSPINDQALNLKLDVKSIRIPFYTYDSIDRCLHSISLLENAAAFMSVTLEECWRIFEVKESPAQAIVEFCVKAQGFTIPKTPKQPTV